MTGAPLQRVRGRLCSIEDCGGRHHSRGLCEMHYVRLLKHGDPHHDTYGQMILSRVDQSAGPGGCWLWTGCTNRGGYGLTKFRGRTTGAHRAVYRLLVGPIPEGLDLDHLCSVRLCVNPAHLEPVTHAENVRRAMKRRAA